MTTDSSTAAHPSTYTPVPGHRFHVGERVMVKRAFPPGHRRTPYYIRGRQGVVERICVYMIRRLDLEETLRTIDYLQSRREVASDRIATMGISGGGTVSLFAGAVDERIRAAVVSCYFNTFRDSIVSLSHCLDNYVPGLLQYMEMYDVAGLVAPRGLFVESGDEDRIFPIEGARVAYARTEPIFRTFAAEDRLGREIFAGGHEFHGVGAFDFLGRVV